jgi:hypothetical protein
MTLAVGGQLRTNTDDCGISTNESQSIRELQRFIANRCGIDLAEKAGFEPAEGITLRTLSRRVT